VVVLREQEVKHPKRAFTFRGRPVSKADTKAWRVALKPVGIPDFRWHYLQHTWAGCHVQKGTPLHILQELGDWESSDMVRRYDHLPWDHLAERAHKLVQPRVVNAVDTRPAQA